jgi:hypothetical protein
VSRDAKESRPTPTLLVRRDGSTAESWGAARGYSRRPFRAGNMRNLRHGAYSERVISDVAVDVGKELLESLKRSVRLQNDDNEPTPPVDCR